MGMGGEGGQSELDIEIFSWISTELLRSADLLECLQKSGCNQRARRVCVCESVCTAGVSL